ncbi:hypothetical protein [Blastococcus sp. TF02A-35]|uniref:hypothetical protein n=1 Tax=Blastococcus sp. TF02A-35 TaxID=2559612 RepID=UPI0014301AD9|nr:hypothetical protein [Blastococcus sp. TF02A_35]
MAKHFTDETAEFAMPRIGRHAAPDTTPEMEPTQRFVPDFTPARPGRPAVPPRDARIR